MKSPIYLAIAVSIALASAACSRSEDDAAQTANADADSAQAEKTMTDTGQNPLLVESDLQFGAPRFDLIKDEHFMPAFEQGMAEHKAEIEAIAGNPEPPTFENTLVEMEKSGRALSRVSSVFFNLSSADSNDKRQEIRAELAPKLSAHYNELVLNPALFERVKAIHEQRDELDLDAESKRLVEETYIQFVRAGAKLSEEEKTRIKEISEEMSKLTTQFSQNVLKEVNDSAVVFDSREALAGLSEAEINKAADEAKDRGMEGRFVITLQNTSQ